MGEEEEVLPQPLGASGARAEALQERIDRLALKIEELVGDIIDLGKTITPLLIGGGQQALVDELKEREKSLKEQQAELKALLKPLQEELAELKAAQASPPADEGNPTLPLSIYAVLDGNAAIGVSFFVSPTRALTALHNLIPISTTDPLDNSAVFQLASSLDVTLKREDGSLLKVKVVRCDKRYDYVLLESAVPVQHFLNVGPAPPAHGLRECFLLTWDIAPGFAVHRALVSRISNHHIAYDANTFDGDCGGALILKRDFTVIGMHQETVNRARELERLTKDVGGRLKDVEDSVESLIRGEFVVAVPFFAFVFLPVPIATQSKGFACGGDLPVRAATGIALATAQEMLGKREVALRRLSHRLLQ
ncbi:hypothetical protein BASA81_013253 [Batrachochytrium salamandrivorans]|nr:hypothetical protein BASA81_013253 [Batrachochytrium salamandrivorans]